MTNQLLFVVWFFLPAGFANMAPIFANKIPLLIRFSQPVDFYKTFRNKRIFGDNKRIRGIVSGIIFGIIIVIIEKDMYMHIPYLHRFIFTDYSRINPSILGGLFGFGALFGDLIKSFFKRQIGIKPGKSWFLFDQTDYIFGGILFTYFYIHIAFLQYLLLIIVWFFLHILVSFLGFLLKLKTSPM